ncbi:MAG: hypothetical protein AB1750_15550, partial [Chloroflexota bacterium]
LAEKLDDRYLTAYAFQALGCSQILRSEFDEAERSFEKCYAIYEALDKTSELAMTVGDLGLAIGYQGDIHRANDLLEHNWSLIERLEDIRTKAHLLLIAGGVKVPLGEWQIATDMLRQCVLLSRQVNNALLIGDALILLAGAANGENMPIRAARLYGASEVVHESIGAIMDPGFRHYYSIFVEQTRTMLDESTFAAAWAEGRKMTMEQAIQYALNEE